MKHCQVCGQELPDDSVFCNKCGAKLEEKIVCRNCGKELDEGSAFCRFCGTAVSTQTGEEDDIDLDSLETDLPEEDDIDLDSLILETDSPEEDDIDLDSLETDLEEEDDIDLDSLETDSPEEDDIDLDSLLTDTKENAPQPDLQIWKKALPSPEEIEYKVITDRVSVESEEFKYKGVMRTRFAVKKNSYSTLFTFIPEFSIDRINDAWIWKDYVFMLGCYGDYNDRETFLLKIKVNGKKAKKVVSGLGRNNMTAYYRVDHDEELMFVNEDKGEFLWYNMQNDENRHLDTGIDCAKHSFVAIVRESVTIDPDPEAEEQNKYQGYQIYADGHVLINKEFLFDRNGNKEAIRDYLDCDSILAACKNVFFEKLFLTDKRARWKKLDHVSIRRVTSDLRTDVRIRISDITPSEVIIPMGSRTFRYDNAELRPMNDHSHSVDAVVEEFPDLQAVINGMKKDLRFGYAAGEEDAAIGYVYGRSESELLLACSYASRRCLGFYSMKGKRLELAEVNPEEDGDSVSWLVEAFREGMLYTKPKIMSSVSKADLDARYAIDESGFDVMSVVGKGLASFIRNKIKIDSGDHDKEVRYKTCDLERSILHCAGLLTDGRIHYVYPPKDDSGENIPDDRIKGALLLACIGEIGIKEKMLVAYSNDHPNMIRVCKNVPWKSNRSEWWADIRDSFRIIEIPNMATEDDAAAIVPSLFPPAGVRFEGLGNGFTGGDVTVVLRHDDTYYSGADIDPMEHVYLHRPLLVIFEGRLWGKVVHPSCRDLRAGVCCKDGFLYATNEGAFFRMKSGRGVVLTKAPNVCGLKYLPDENMIQVFLFKDLRQYEYNQHYDTCGYMYEEWRNSYHTDVEIKSYNYEGIVRQLS